MANKEFHYRWEWSLKSAPEQIWPLVADTNRFDRDTGIPALKPSPGNQAFLNGRVQVALFQYGIPLEYEQEPFEWTYPNKFSVVRNFKRGPLEQLRVEVELQPKEAGTYLVYQVFGKPRNLLGSLGHPFQIGWLLKRRFGSTFLKYDQLAQHGNYSAKTNDRIRLASGAIDRLARHERELVGLGFAPGLVLRLIQTVQEADDLVASRMRPYEFADYWQSERRKTLELFLTATRAGLLRFRWDVLCPHCRIAKQSAGSLSALQMNTYCETCHIDYETNFSQSVELTFRPNDSIRALDNREFCIGSPYATPHILSQRLLKQGDVGRFLLRLDDGHYRLRAYELGGGQYFRVGAELQREHATVLTTSGWEEADVHLSNDVKIRVQNDRPDEQLILLERLGWSNSAVTAAEVIALQKFRDLFSNEALRPGERISVGSMAIVFTDLRGSTRLYKEIGDAPAFGHVMDHFVLIREVFAEEDGALIKTLGDSVMAAFRHSGSALNAVRRAQIRLSSLQIGGKYLQLKAGINFGPCIAVTLNERLDFFGSAVNVASRLESYSNGDDVFVSESVFSDPEVTALIRRDGLQVERCNITLKGFENEPIPAWRLFSGVSTQE